MPEIIKDMKRAVFPSDSTPPLYGGPSLTEAIDDVNAETALFRLHDGGRCIWEITLHAAYWRREVAHALTDGDLSRMQRGPENWPALPKAANDAAWRADRDELEASEWAFHEALDRFDIKRWRSKPKTGGDWTLGQLAIGLLAHDAYHVGQIVLLKKVCQLAEQR